MKRMYAARDSVSGSWQDPQAFMNDQDAIRSFCFALAYASVPDSFVKDIDLYFIGTFDETTGELAYSEKLIHVTNGRCDLYDAYLKVKNGTYTSEDYNNEIFSKA